MDKLLLNFVLFFAKAFLKNDVDTEKLKIIAGTHLMMDRRRSRVSMKMNTKKEPKNQLLITQIVYVFFGFLVGTSFFAVKDIVPCMVILHSYILFMMAMTLITDFSTVLLDTTDNQIILPRPVSSKTIFVSRLVHVLVYLLQFTIALAFVPLIFTFILFGAAVGLAAIITVLLTVIFAVFFTYLLYGIILRLGSEEKIKDIISWSQIGLTVFFAVGYQIIPRLLNYDNLRNAVELHWYSYFLPPVWMAMALQTIQQRYADGPHTIMIFLALIVPVVAFWVMIKYIAPAFARKLEAMGNSKSDRPAISVHAGTKNRSLVNKISPFLFTDNTEQAGYELTGKMTARDKGFKIKFYPSLAYLLVFAFVFVFKSGKDLDTVWLTLPATKLFLWLVYLPLFAITSAITLIPYTESFAASWLYLASPLHKPGSLITGAIKSLLVKFFLPIYILLAAFAVYVWGAFIIDDFILGFTNCILVFLLMSVIGKSYLPFSMQPNVQEQSGKIIQLLLQLIVVAILVGLHWLALSSPWLVMALIPFSAAGCILLFRYIRNYSWHKISF